MTMRPVSLNNGLGSPVEDLERRKLDRFQALVQTGLDDLEAGRVTEVHDLALWFDTVESDATAAALIAAE